MAEWTNAHAWKACVPSPVPRVRSLLQRAPAEIAGESLKFMYYLYLLKLKDDTVYTGRSDNLKRRIEEHKRGKVKSTKNKLPVTLIYYEAYVLKRDAIKRELYLKTGDGRREIKKRLRYTLQLKPKRRDG